MTQKTAIQNALDCALASALVNQEGQLATYIPELACASPELTGAAVRLKDGSLFVVGNAQDTKVTLQSVAKLVVLIGLLEEEGLEKVASWVHFEPSGFGFSSVVRLELSDMPFNPMLNSGAITLCSHIPGNVEQRLEWLKNWMRKLFGEEPVLNQKVFASERRTGSKNRALAYILKTKNLLSGSVERILDTYFSLCSFETTVSQATYLPMLLANGGLNEKGVRIISRKTCQQVIATMATCGLYNESGEYLLETGMPAKSGISGFIVAVALGQGGVAVLSPRVNEKGSSVRGRIILESLSQQLDWHF